jgi:hypothetical protein
LGVPVVRLREAFAFGAGPDQRGDEVLAWILATGRHDIAEQAAHGEVAFAQAPLGRSVALGVVAHEDRIRPALQRHAVGIGHAHHLGDDEGRQWAGVVGNEID